MKGKEIVPVPGITEALARHKVPFSAVVRANGFVFVSGMPPMDLATGGFVKGDIATQTAASLEAVRHCLQAAGSDLDRVVSTRVYCLHASAFPVVNEVYGRYFPEDPPTRTFVTVAAWPLPFDIEIEVVALA